MDAARRLSCPECRTVWLAHPTKRFEVCPNLHCRRRAEDLETLSRILNPTPKERLSSCMRHDDCRQADRIARARGTFETHEWGSIEVSVAVP